MAHPSRMSAVKPDLDALRSFSELPDREASPFFGGRAEEIGLVEGALNRIRERGREGHWRPSGGETILFQGAPGAGKSALLHHLVHLWYPSGGASVLSRGAPGARKSALLRRLLRRWRGAGRDAPVVVDTEASHYADERALALRVAEAFDPSLAAQFRHSVTTHSSTTRSLGTGLLGVAAGYAATETGQRVAAAPAEPSLDAVKEALSKSRQHVVLILDEAQDLEGFDADSVRPVVSKLHKGSHGGPILTVFAGLAHSDAVLQSCGISRFSIGHDRTLEALSFDEAVEIVHLMFTECRVCGDEEIMRLWAHALAEESSGWPQHLHVAMRALAAQLLSASVPGQLEAVDSDFGVAVLRASASARDEYYERRIDEPLASARRLVAETFRRIGDEATSDEVLEYIRAATRTGCGLHSLPRDHDEVMLLDRMIRRGLLQRTRKKTLACPIPSLRGYIERMAQHAMPET